MNWVDAACLSKLAAIAFGDEGKERIMGCENCGSCDYEQSGDQHNMTIHCLRCGHVTFLESYRDEGEDKWRRDRDDRR